MQTEAEEYLRRADSAGLGRLLRRKERQIDRLFDLYGSSRISKSMLESQIERLLREKAEIEKQVEEAKRGEEGKSSLRARMRSLSATVSFLQRRLDDVAREEKAQIIRLLVDEVVVKFDGEQEKHLIEVCGRVPLMDEREFDGTGEVARDVPRRVLLNTLSRSCIYKRPSGFKSQGICFSVGAEIGKRLQS